MAPDDQKKFSRRAFEVWVSGNTVKPEEFFAENYVNHQEPSVEGGVKALNLAQWKELNSGYHKSFSNSKATYFRQLAENDLVATHWQLAATQSGEYLGLAPTNKETAWTGVQIDRFENGKIAESWVNWDLFRLMEELGMVKVP